MSVLFGELLIYLDIKIILNTKISFKNKYLHKYILVEYYQTIKYTKLFSTFYKTKTSKPSI